MKYLFIANPIAGKGKTKKIVRYIKKFLIERKVDHLLIETTRSGEIPEIFQKYKDEFDRVIVVGGDGTCHELINSNMFNQKIIGVLPTGSGNDFAFTLGLTKNLYRDLQTLLNQKTLDLDVGYAELIEFSGKKLSFLFANSIGIGFDAEVANTVKKIKYIRGIFLYLLGVFKTLINYKFRKLNVNSREINLTEPLFMISIGNGKTAGGGFKLTPLANPIDGLIDVCIVKKINKLKVLQILPFAIFGKHLTNKAVLYFQTKELYITSEDPIYVHADGEIRSNQMKSIKIVLLNRYAKFLTDGVSYADEKT